MTIYKRLPSGWFWYYKDIHAGPFKSRKEAESNFDNTLLFLQIAKLESFPL